MSKKPLPFHTLELTMIRDKTQLLNSETNSIARHLLESLDSKKGFALLLAPRIHSDVINYFNFLVSMNRDNNLIITGTPIIRFINWLREESFVSQIKMSSIFEFVETEYKEVELKNMETIKKVVSSRNLEKIN
ncbi:AlwI restriction endonuclease [Spiroplasma poulsonii]|uniref:AlwI restriction endonuclease n=1 Tax=Spiroplasma poulsonii TaxID=2138 RepID=A0A2P6FC33_9MOLU|nr:AlwI restriction endonuclease [Spiroplasma poulsonii]PQM30986.1 AlwI restriction endonuclease [Spiroplasma poulsonii]PWF95979.1 AlwI restriction endonuclease [Spiroplasma poulsonii]PWF98755.1 AlwI restriction endonuclease [Spiroplasma poulsonii]